MADTSIVVKLIDETRAGFQSINSNLDSLDRNASALKSSFDGLKTAAAAFVGVLASRSALDFVNTIQTMDNRLKLVTKSQGELNTTFEGLFDVAQKTRAPLTETVDLYSKLAQNQEVSRQSSEDLRKVTEAFTTSLAISGTSGQAAAGAITQFAQAMASGKLSGDEFRTMAEANPRLLQAISEQTKIARENLKEMASKGFLTAEIAATALKQALPELQKEMANTDVTVSQAITNMVSKFQELGRSFLEESGTSAALVDAIQFITENMENLIPIIKLVGVALAAVFVYFAPWTAALAAVSAAVVYFSDKLGPIAQTILDAFGKALEAVVPKLAGVGAALLALANLENPFTAYTKASEESAASFVKNTAVNKDLKAATDQTSESTKKATGLTDEMKTAFDRAGLSQELTKTKLGDYLKTLDEGIKLAGMDKDAKEAQQAVTKALQAAEEDHAKNKTKLSAEEKARIEETVRDKISETQRIRAQFEEQTKDREDAYKKAVELLNKFAQDAKKQQDDQLSATEKFTKDSLDIEAAYNDALLKGQNLTAAERRKIEEDYHLAVRGIQTQALSDLTKEYGKYAEDSKNNTQQFVDAKAKIEEAYRIAMTDAESLTAEEVKRINDNRDKALLGAQNKFSEDYRKTAEEARTSEMTATQKFTDAMKQLDDAFKAGLIASQEQYDALRLAAQNKFGEEFKKAADQQRKDEMTASEKYAEAIFKLNEAQNAGLITSQEQYDLVRRKIEKEYRDDVTKEYSNLYGVLTEKIQQFTGLNTKEFGLLKDTVKLVFGVDIDTIIKQAFAEFIKYVIGFRQAGDSEIGLFTGIFSKIFGKSGSGAKEVGDFASEGTSLLKGFGTGGEGIFSSIGSVISSVFSGGLNVIAKFASSAFDILKGLGKGAGSIFDSIGGFIGDVFSGGGGGILDTVIDGVGSLLDFGSSAGSVLGSIGEGLGVVGSALGTIGLAAAGIGIITGIGDALGLDKLFGVGAYGSAAQAEKAHSAIASREANDRAAYTEGSQQNKALKFQASKDRVAGGMGFAYDYFALGLPLPNPSYRAQSAKSITSALKNIYGVDIAESQVPKSYHYALGGIVNRQTMFPMDGGSVGIAGEAGPEAILPLSRGANGELGVQGGGPVNISFTINAIDSRGIDQLLVEKRQFITNMVRSATAERGRKVF